LYDPINDHKTGRNISDYTVTNLYYWVTKTLCCVAPADDERYVIERETIWHYYPFSSFLFLCLYLKTRGKSLAAQEGIIVNVL